MFGARTSQVFTSRWKAVVWSLGILTTAYCTIPSAEDTAASAASVATPDKPGQSSEQEAQAREVLKNIESLRKTGSSGE